MLRDRLSRARRLLLVILACASISWAAAVSCLLMAIALLLARVDVVVGGLLTVAVLLGAIVAGAISLWRGRYASSLERFALWVEERQGGLQHALVTAVDSASAPADRYPDLHRLASQAQPIAVVRRASIRMMISPLLLLLAGLVSIATLGPLDRLTTATGRHDGSGSSHNVVDPLAELTVEVVSPAYSHRPDITLRNPLSVSALPGSHLVLAGRGSFAGLTARLGNDSIAAVGEADGWRIPLVMPLDPTAMTLTDGARRRLLALVPVVDSVPEVRLRLPAEDTTYQSVPSGDLIIEASLRDDIGLARAQVEYMVSTGSDENFETHLSTGKLLSLGGARTGVLHEVARFDALKLMPGSVMHIRVLAWDGNDVSGPGKGVSETRTLRVAEPVDSTDAEAAPPPPIDSMWISQRLLNMKTDSLIGSRARLGFAIVAQRSDDYSQIQESLRQHTLAVISEIEGDPDDPSSTTTVISRELRQVAEMMVTARTHLAAAAPTAAIPFMRRILQRLDALRLANRYYLRGHPRPRTVDLARTRLTGTDPARHAVRQPGAVLVDASAALSARLDDLVAMARRAPAEARDSLTMLRVQVSREAPAVAGALDLALQRLNRGVTMDSALAPVRRALVSPPLAERGTPAWLPLP